MKKIIVDTLSAIEEKESITILCARDTGSRAWGSASPKSDYDVRYIFIQPIYKYLSIKEALTVIKEKKREDALDIVGWNLRDVLKSIHNSNIEIFEWTQSPIQYKTTPHFEMKLQDLTKQFASKIKHLEQYNDRLRLLRLQIEHIHPIPTKTYIQATKIAILCRMNRENNLLVYPHNIQKLIESIPEPGLQTALLRLLAYKKEGTPQRLRNNLPVVDAFLDEEIHLTDEHLKSAEETTRRIDSTSLDIFFQDTLNECTNHLT